jgi:hypothetical protein
MHRRTLLGLAMASVAAPALADVPPPDWVTALRFNPGTTAATFSGRVRGYETTRYSVAVRRGQTLRVTMRPSHPSLYFSIRDPSGAVVSDGTLRTGQTASLVTASDGAYQIHAFFMRNEARRGAHSTFRMTVSVTG